VHMDAASTGLFATNAFEVMSHTSPRPEENANCASTSRRNLWQMALEIQAIARNWDADCKSAMPSNLSINVPELPCVLYYNAQERVWVDDLHGKYLGGGFASLN
jgi:hypothetical protein